MQSIAHDFKICFCYLRLRVFHRVIGEHRITQRIARFLQQMRTQELSRCNRAISTNHLNGSNQDIALADNHVRHIAGQPLGFFGDVFEIFLFPCRRGNTTLRFTGKVDLCSSRIAKFLNEILHGLITDGGTGIVEALCYFIEHNVAGNDDALTQAQQPMT